jgi:hypothetical protein
MNNWGIFCNQCFSPLFTQKKFEEMGELMKEIISAKKVWPIIVLCTVMFAACSTSDQNSDSGDETDSDFPCAVARNYIDNGTASQALIDNYNRECQ